MNKQLIIFTDIGDTIINEKTEVRKPMSEIVLQGECIPGAKGTALKLYEEGYPIVMVADGYVTSFRNLMDLNGLSHIFSAKIISEEVGINKPSPRMFDAAMKAMELTEEDKKRIIMIGNNLERDIIGANNYGITSVFIDWSDKRRKVPNCKEEEPDYTVHAPEELIPLVHMLEEKLENGAETLKN